MINNDDYKPIADDLDTLYRDTIEIISRLGRADSIVLQLTHSLNSFVNVTSKVAPAEFGLSLSTVDEEAEEPLALGVPKAEHLLRKLRAIQLVGSRLHEGSSDLLAILNGLQLAILNGTKTAGTYRQCVAIETRGSQYECSGVIVAPKWLITSTHCPQPSKVFIGDDIYDAVFGINEFAVVDRGVAKGTYGAVRVAEILGSVPSPEVGVLTDSCKFESGDATIVGFGLEQVAGVFGVKRSGTVEIVKWVPPDIVTKPNPNDVCAGDSGGPLVVDKNGVQVVVGLIEESLRVNCGSGAVYTMLESSLVAAIEKIVGAKLKVCTP